MIENERGTAINPDDAVQEKISLSDRFGLASDDPGLAFGAHRWQFIQELAGRLGKAIERELSALR
jgi:Protein of unknown function (DUF815)